MRKVYQVEVGVLLDKTDPEYQSYNTAFGGKYSYYNENIWFTFSKKEALKTAKEYVDKGVDGTYGIISYVGQCGKEYKIENGNIVDEEGYDCSNEFTDWSEESVIKMYAKIDKEEDYKNG